MGIKRKRIIILLLIMVVLLVGCDELSDILIQVDEIVFDQSKELDTDNAVVNETLITDDKSQGIPEIETTVEDTRQLQAVMSNQISYENRYAYQLLEETQKHLYIEVLAILENQLSDVEVSSLDIDEIDYIFQCVLIDYPELFYVEGYSHTKFTRNKELNKIEFSGNYSMNNEEIAIMQKEVDQVVRECLSNISIEEDDYVKVKYVYDYIINRTEYKLESKENQNILSVFLQGESVCKGYAKAMQYLLMKLQVPTTLVIGTVNEGERHAWNLVTIDGDNYYVDATWGDASYVFGASETESNIDSHTINYDYLCVTTEQLVQTHKIDNIIELPVCVEMKANYYVMENAYFSSMDIAKIKKLFDKAYATGELNVKMKCQNQQVYDEIINTLIKDQEIFKYLEDGNNKVSYTFNEKNLTLSIWI